MAKLLNTPVGFGNRYRYIEERIYPGDRLYTIGLFKTRDDLDHQLSRNEQVRELLRQWKRDKTGLLARFDLNRDGDIDPKEWELVRKAATAHAELEQPLLQARQDLHILRTTNSHRHPFLLSTLPQFSLVRRYRFKAFGAITVFFLSGALSIWMMGLRID